MVRLGFSVIALVCMVSTAGIASSKDDEMISRIFSVVTETPFIELINADFTFYTPVARARRLELQAQLEKELLGEQKKSQAFSTEDYINTFRHFEITRILKNYQSNFPFYWRMEQIGLDVYASRFLLDLLQYQSRDQDRERIKSFLTYKVKSKRLGYHLKEHFTNSPLVALCNLTFKNLMKRSAR